MGRILLLGCLMGLSLLAQAGDLYRWVDANGKPQYGDMPPPGAVMIEQLEFFDEAAADAGLPYETRRALKDFPVTLYVADNCIEFCEQARSLLKTRGIPYSEKAVRTQEEVDAFKAAAGDDGVPAMSVGKIFINGFNAERWNSELNIAGYPKTSPYQMPKISPEDTAAASAAAPGEPAAATPSETAPIDANTP